MFTLTAPTVHRRVVVSCPVPADQPDVVDVQLSYRASKIRPDFVQATFLHESAGWRLERLTVAGLIVLKSGAVGTRNSDTRIGGFFPVLATPISDTDDYAEAPWAFDWAAAIQAQLNTEPVAHIGDIAVGDAPDLDEAPAVPDGVVLRNAALRRGTRPGTDGGC
jgi:hypothetical protein